MCLIVKLNRYNIYICSEVMCTLAKVGKGIYSTCLTSIKVAVHNVFKMTKRVHIF